MDQVRLEPYIFFQGNCKEAMEFYTGIFGGELFMQTYGEVKMGDESQKDHIMHAKLEGDVVILASDTAEASAKAAKISLTLDGADEEKLRKYFDGLSEGGDVRSPLKKEFWGDTFGSLVDKYGVDWMVNITEQKA